MFNDKTSIYGYLEFTISWKTNYCWETINKIKKP